LKSHSNTTNNNLKTNVHGLLFVLERKDSPQPSLDDHSPHIMLSYEWGSKELARKIKGALTAKGYKVWIDIDHIQGSILEAMAFAVEHSQLVLICVSRKYKESPACRMEAEYLSIRFSCLEVI